MNRRTLPVAVQRWFEEGESWGYHPDFPKLQKAIRAVRKQLHSPKNELQFAIPFHNGKLVGDKLPDGKCINAKARGRDPFILRFAYLDEERCDDETVESVRDGLRHLPLPTKEGESESLKISLPIAPCIANESAVYETLVTKLQKELGSQRDTQARQEAEILTLENALHHEQQDSVGWQSDFEEAEGRLRWCKILFLAALCGTLLSLPWWSHISVPKLVLNILVIVCASLGLYVTRGTTILSRSQES